MRGADMRTMRERKSWVAALAIVVLFGACKGESPTAPPTGGGTPPGGTIPPAGVTLTVTTTNTDPLIDSSVVITATATLNGQPVPNGTAVEFETNVGIFDNTPLATSIVKTTTNGVASVTLSSATAGAARVHATVNNVDRIVDITFRERPIVTPPPGTAPTITSVTPSVGRPAGGQLLHITGTNFKSPLRVLFGVGQPLPVEGSVQNVTDTGIDVISPAVNVTVGQELAADIVVITEAGSSREQRVTKTGGFTFRNEVLTPRVSTATPNSGPVTGGTRVTIIGDGFQAPVQVLFGTAEAKVISVNFTEIIVESPAARDTAPDGSGTVTGPVSILVRNINSSTSVTLTPGFNYKNAMQITAVGPTEGPFTGQTRVTIDGTGFVAPVAVVIGGFTAQPLNVSGTRIIALTSPIALTGCGDVTGETTVTNIVNGDQAVGPDYTFRVPKPAIISIQDLDGAPTLPGDTLAIVVANAIAGVNRITIADRVVFITGTTFNPDGSATFTVALPSNFVFPTESCLVGAITGVRPTPLTVNVTYLNIQTTCTDTAANALTITPPDTSCILAPPNASLSPTTPPCIPLGDVTAAGTATGSTTFQVSNTGGQNLIISSFTVSANSNTTTVTVTPSAPQNIAPGASRLFTVTVDPTAPGAFSATIDINSNDPDSPAQFCVTGNGI
jgi:IPT/TIG domain-containing protein/uncharacterized protein DUF1573